VKSDAECAAVTTTFFLVRHAAYRQLDRVLVGRLPGVRLAKEGRDQAGRLAERLRHERITAVQSSPRERARETAGPIAEYAALPLEVVSAIDEIDMGEWTGQSFAALNQDLRWKSWNAARSMARPPRGESMLELQQRVVRHLDDMHSADPDGRIVVVSHAEAIRAAILYYLGLPLDEFARIEVGPATISTIALDRHGGKVVGLNEAVAP